MKTTKEIMKPFMFPDTRLHKEIKEHINDKWFSVSDVKQLQKELKSKMFKGCDCLHCVIHENILNSIFNNFKGKFNPSKCSICGLDYEDRCEHNRSHIFRVEQDGFNGGMIKMLRNGQKMIKLIVEHLKQKNGVTGVYDADIVQFIFNIDDNNFNELIKVSKIKGK